METKKEQFSSHLQTFVVSLVIIILLVVFLAANNKPSSLEFDSPELVNTASFALPHYSHFVYNVTLHDVNYSDVADFSIVPTSSCTAIVLENTQPSAATCVYPNGKDNSNSSYSLNNSLFFVYRPWMLALKEGFNWMPYTYLTFSGGRVPFNSEQYRVVGEQNWRGRPAFVVDVIREDGTARLYVDKEYRVLLEEKEAQASITLIRGPFPLEPQEE